MNEIQFKIELIWKFIVCDGYSMRLKKIVLLSCIAAFLVGCSASAVSRDQLGQTLTVEKGKHRFFNLTTWFCVSEFCVEKPLHRGGDGGEGCRGARGWVRDAVHSVRGRATGADYAHPRVV